MNDSFPGLFKKIGLKHTLKEIEKNKYLLTIEVKAKPGSKKEKTEINNEGQLCVHLKERPVNGQANKGIIKHLSKTFAIPNSQIELSKGLKSKVKKFDLLFILNSNKSFCYFQRKILDVLS